MVLAPLKAADLAALQPAGPPPNKFVYF